MKNYHQISTFPQLFTEVVTNSLARNVFIILLVTGLTAQQPGEQAIPKKLRQKGVSFRTELAVGVRKEEQIIPVSFSSTVDREST